MGSLASRTLLRPLGTSALVQVTVGATCAIGEDSYLVAGEGAEHVTTGAGATYSLIDEHTAKKAASSVATCSITGADASRMTAGAGSTYSINGAVASWATARA